MIAQPSPLLHLERFEYFFGAEDEFALQRNPFALSTLVSPL